MIIHVKDKMTAAEVRKLPVGSIVTWHGRDRRGYSTELDCTVVQSGKTKVLAYSGWNGMTEKKPIRDLPNKYFTLKQKAGEQ